MTQSTSLYNPTYIIERNATKFGGKQEDYLKFSNQVIFKAVEEIQTAVQQNQDLKKLFFKLLTDFNCARKQIAQSHGTAHPERFGRRRDLEGTEDFYHTYLTHEYSDCNQKILMFFKECMQKMSHDEKKFFEKKRKFEVEYEGIRSSFEIEILDAEELSNRKWDTPMNAQELLPYIPETLLKKDRNELTENQSLLFAQGLKKYKQDNPEGYKRLKMTSHLFDLEREFPSPKVIQSNDSAQFLGNEAHLKSFFALGTLRLELHGKMYALSQYLTWLYRDFKQDPLERMLKCSKVQLIHQDKFLIEETLSEIASIFERAVLKHELHSLKRECALFRYEFAHCMPLENGSAAESEWFEMALYLFHQIHQIHYPKGTMTDLEAFSAPLLPQFMKKYDSLISFVN